ncbi:hypothetical protein AX16_005654 [Volvariella volvacea WC 439]|nr:hypothetical protein AX16_005654 [Volvariella volvacea WC 439]
MSFYRLKQFQCEVTGKSGLDYFQALESERQEARTMHSRFPEPLKPAVLKAVQWQVMGRLDHLVEAVYDRFKDRYFPEEKVVVDQQGCRYHARIESVILPKGKGDVHRQPISQCCPELHSIGDLKTPLKDVIAKDDPMMYEYRVRVLEMEKEKANEKNKSTAKVENPEALIGETCQVPPMQLSRDRLSFSKSILRRFIRDCVDREAAVASPWTVKASIAKRYGVDSVMPEETRKGVETIKKGEIDKRKKVWEDKEGPPTKKHKKMTAAQEEKAEKREREAREKAEKQRLAKEEAERLAAEKKKKKPTRYPTEDLDVRVSEKDKKAGIKVRKPTPDRASLPFNDTPGAFEAFLMGWNFLVVYGQPLHLSAFTLDDFEHALRHSVQEPTCNLLAEVHSTLIYNLRTVPFQRHSALVSLLRKKDEMEEAGLEDERVFGVSIEQLTNAMADVGNNWERVPLRASEGREGWEDALLGCLKDHATIETLPRLREILTRLLFSPESVDHSRASTSSRGSTPSNTNLTSRSTPAERYYSLPPADRIAILSFMCNLAVSSKAIHAHMESCEEQLTALRKEKIEVNRLKKQYTEEMAALAEEAKESPPKIDEDVVMDSSELSDISPSEAGSEANGKKGTARQKQLRQKVATQAHAKQREAARAKQASIKQAIAEHRRLDEEVNKLERRLEGIEREFRKLLGAVRVKPLGRDRFYNRIWWFDGMGGASLVGSGGVAQYGAGRVFIQGPSEIDVELLEKRKDEDISQRRLEEEGEGYVLGAGDWAVYGVQDDVSLIRSSCNRLTPTPLLSSRNLSSGLTLKAIESWL